jgi:hypothetical protein
MPWRVRIKPEAAEKKPAVAEKKPEAAGVAEKSPKKPEVVDLTGDDEPPPAPVVKASAGRKEVVGKNYAAMDATGNFGLIDDGRLDLGVRDLLAHIPRKRQAEYSFAMRPGDVLQVTNQFDPAKRRPRRLAPSTPMRVLFTTPARYYAPGTRVTTLRVGVAEQDWRRVFARETGI